MKTAVEEWLTAARDDLETVSEIVENPRLTHVVAFHAHSESTSSLEIWDLLARGAPQGHSLASLGAHQCIERGFKAVLEKQEGDVPNIHNLITLHGRIEEYLPEDAEIDFDLLDRLNQLYIDARYPGERGLLPEGKPTEQEAQRLYAFAQHIFEGVRQRLQNSGETQ